MGWQVVVADPTRYREALRPLLQEQMSHLSDIEVENVLASGEAIVARSLSDAAAVSITKKLDVAGVPSSLRWHQEAETSDSQPRPRRRRWVTIIAGLFALVGFVGALGALQELSSALATGLSRFWITAALAKAGVALWVLIMAVGLWRMRKWGAVVLGLFTGLLCLISLGGLAIAIFGGRPDPEQRLLVLNSYFMLGISVVMVLVLVAVGRLWRVGELR